MDKMKVLDLFCGAGGAAMGLHYALEKAGIKHEITGVDIVAQKHYPFHFIQADALVYPLEGYDFYWASPPCQGYSIMRNLPWNKGKSYPLLIDKTRGLLQATGMPYIIENVMGAHLKAGYLCGLMFGLPFYRHRAFESSYFWLQPSHSKHLNPIVRGRYLKGRARTIVIPQSVHSGGSSKRDGIKFAKTNEIRLAMGIDWMIGNELTQAIPPAYSEYLMNCYLKTIQNERP